MVTLNCPKCHKEFAIDISKAIDENGEVFFCPHCQWMVRYTNK